MKLWGINGVRGISSDRVGPIIRFHGNINANVYKEFFRNHAPSHLRKETIETPGFMQDNSSCHKAKIVLGFLEQKAIAAN